MAGFGLTDKEWNRLCGQIRRGFCVPVVGGWIRKGLLPTPEVVSARWAEEIGYPLTRATELAMVAQYAATQGDENELVDDFAELWEKWLQDLNDRGLDWAPTDHPIRLLAELPFKVYVTTAFDDLLARAIRRYRPDSNPVEIRCLWRPIDRDWRPPAPPADDVKPSVEAPWIFHLHGQLKDPPSMVLTESDHMVFGDTIAADCLQNNEKSTLLHPEIRTALVDSTWFFVGYGAADRNLRGMLRSLTTLVDNHKTAIAVQLQRDEFTTGREADADQFLTTYLSRLLDRSVQVVFSDAQALLSAIKAEM